VLQDAAPEHATLFAGLSGVLQVDGCARYDGQADAKRPPACSRSPIARATSVGDGAHSAPVTNMRAKSKLPVGRPCQNGIAAEADYVLDGTARKHDNWRRETNNASDNGVTVIKPLTVPLASTMQGVGKDPAKALATRRLLR